MPRIPVLILFLLRNSIMKTLKSVRAIRKHLADDAVAGRSIGFIPTMGALHPGHVSLAEMSVEENDVTVVSVFVNPTQFNQKEDLEKYPRNLKRDQELLAKAGVDYIFAPTVSEVYPERTDTSVDLDISAFVENMEGPNRPGHFDGVVQVVHRLLKILEPDRIYMGQKDFQQFMIIRYMIEQLEMPVKLVVHPIVRENNGLAMSSRNERLTEETKEKAGIIHDQLIFAKENLGAMPVNEIEAKALDALDTGEFRPEYFEIFDGISFERVTDPEQHRLVVAGTAVWAGPVRLIDNMILKGREIVYSV